MECSNVKIYGKLQFEKLCIIESFRMKGTPRITLFYKSLKGN